MVVRRVTSVSRVLNLLAFGLLIGCSDQTVGPGEVSPPSFTKVKASDPTQILTVGVDAPIHLTLSGTVAGVIVAVDNAIVDLSKATVDCGGQTATGPRIGIRIEGNRFGVHVKGSGSGVVQNCDLGILIGQFDPNVFDPLTGSAVPGGGNNHVDGLTIRNISGTAIGCPMCTIAIGISNSHGNYIDHNTITDIQYAAVYVTTGGSAEASFSGGNNISSNVMMNDGLGVEFFTNNNKARGNLISNAGTGIAVIGQGTGNLVSGNTVNDAGFAFIAWPPSSANAFKGNMATNNYVDAYDLWGDCVHNAWQKNKFVTVDPTCIR